MSSSGDNQRCSTLLTLDARFFSIDAVLRVAYWMSDRVLAVPTLDDDEKTLAVHLSVLSVRASLECPRPDSLDELCEEFRSRLVDAELQVRINRETAGIRELIYAKAFSEAGVLEDAAPGSYTDPVLEHQKDSSMEDAAASDEPTRP